MFSLSFLLCFTGLKPVLFMLGHCLLVYTCCSIFKSITVAWVCNLAILLSLQIDAAKIWQVRRVAMWTEQLRYARKFCGLIAFPKIVADPFLGYPNDTFIIPRTAGIKLPISWKFEVTKNWGEWKTPFGKQGGLMVSALDSGASGPGSSPGRGHCVVFLGKTLNSHSASLSSFHPGV